MGKRPPLHRLSFALDETTLGILTRMKEGVSAQFKVRASGSAIIRALLLHAAGQGDNFLKDNIFPHLRKESSEDRSWGQRPVVRRGWTPKDEELLRRALEVKPRQKWGRRRKM